MLTPAAAQRLKVANQVAKKLGAMIHRKLHGCTDKIAIHTSVVIFLLQYQTGKSSRLRKDFHSDHLVIPSNLTTSFITANILY
jgi:hypothetical protein